jgi:hypothetical protein
MGYRRFTPGNSEERLLALQAAQSCSFTSIANKEMQDEFEVNAVSIYH